MNLKFFFFYDSPCGLERSFTLSVRGSEDLVFIPVLAWLMSVVDVRLSDKSLIYMGSKSALGIEPCGYSTIYDITAGKKNVSTNSSINQTKRYMPVRVVRKTQTLTCMEKCLQLEIKGAPLQYSKSQCGVVLPR